MNRQYIAITIIAGLTALTIPMIAPMPTLYAVGALLSVVLAVGFPLVTVGNIAAGLRTITRRATLPDTTTTADRLPILDTITNETLQRHSSQLRTFGAALHDHQQTTAAAIGELLDTVQRLTATVETLQETTAAALNKVTTLVADNAALQSRLDAMTSAQLTVAPHRTETPRNTAKYRPVAVERRKSETVSTLRVSNNGAKVSTMPTGNHARVSGKRNRSKPELNRVLAYLDANPTTAELSNRKLGDVVGVSHVYAGKAKRLYMSNAGRVN